MIIGYVNFNILDKDESWSVLLPWDWSSVIALVMEA
jgi:hypothetical protein